MRNISQSVRINFISNVIGSIFQTIMGLIFIPIYIDRIGIESWGLIGLFTLLLAIFSLFDMGITPTITRELSRYISQNKSINAINDLLRSIEVPYWVLSIILFFTIYLSSGIISKYWIKDASLSIETINISLFLIAIIIALQLPIGFYSAVLIGLQKQVSLNLINSAASLFRWGGAALILFAITPTVEVYFSWQIISSFINLLLLRVFISNSVLTKEYKPKFKLILFFDLIKFSLKMMSISILALILTQIDKFILINLLSLESFSYYSLASVISFSILKVTGPIINSISPKMINYIERRDLNQLSIFYHRTTEFLSFFILPFCFIIIFFSQEILYLWTKNSIVVKNSYILVSFLTLGTVFNAFMIIPYALQISFGWTRLSIYKNIIAVILIIPTDLFLVKKFGNIGASIGWLLLNLAYVIFEIQFMHRKILIGEKLKWYFYSVIKPLILTVIIIYIGRIFMPTFDSIYMICFYLSFLLFITYFVLFISIKSVRDLFNSLLLSK